MLTKDMGLGCIFIDNPSGGGLSFRLESKRVNFSDARIEIWTTNLEKVDCPKNRCKVRGKRLLARLVKGYAGFVYSIEADFTDHETVTPCGREAVEAWEGKDPYVAPHGIWDLRFLCDGVMIAKPPKLRVGRWIPLVVKLVIVVGVSGFCVLEILKKDRQRPVVEEDGGRLREDAQFLETVEP
jgi:hypothetical protein